MQVLSRLRFDFVIANIESSHQTVLDPELMADGPV